MRLVFLDRCTLPVALRPPGFGHELTEYWQTAPGEVAERLAGADVAITNKVPIRAADLPPGLRLVAIAATGSDCVDLAACRERGIAVCNVRGYAVGSVPEHVFMLVLALRRQLLAYRADVLAGRWQAAPAFCLLDHPIRDLRGSVLGVVGAGALGEATAALGRAFGMEVLVAERRGTSPRPGRVAFDEVLARADVLSLHCPLTPETRGLLGAAELAAMKRGAVLVNTARGALVDGPALLEALQRGHLGGAGIDVLPEEPPVAGHPLLEVALPNLIVTPHVAWAGAMPALAEQLVQNLEAFVAGEPRNLL